MKHVVSQCALLIVVAVMGAGCGSQPQVEITQFDAGEVTKRALQQLDGDKNNMLDPAELKACPGLANALTTIDTDKDGQLSAEELQARFQAYIDEQVALVPQPIDITYRGQPLIGARVELEPEEFLEGVVEPASDETDEYGTARPSIPLDEEIARRGTYGYRSGVYRIRISKQDASGKELLPAKYNVDSKLGIEVKMGGHSDAPMRLNL